ncbi:acetyl-CoA carboxylase biotin carboxyl carrier protein [Heyndrickxia acidicola]|uniref:Biotin carboxyl carrier protein of acetyl-CoA carboxylase n=1 Tax=Heyndrickxia acidicola TaxID=209389 RepID=A0ABU6MKX2_9BACI|nr:acetyl-CoA carboxylase biotin carboxyl carrier protein [Heyndrickxia acidicola]MED1205175.1 acetyl-CoA carboxylase biotin carboxyl carrier protein [Heyndrickxia acidicola]
MLKVQEIRELIKLIDQSSIDEFEYEHEGASIKMKKNTGVTVVEPQYAVQAPPAAVIPAQPIHHESIAASPAPAISEVQKQESVSAVNDANLHKIVSPMVGTFYVSPSPDSDPYVQEGSKVQANTVVCIVEAMKLFNEIEAEVDGEIVEVLVKDGQLVEYGQPLFLVKSK